jgi:hypothetical protein
MELQIWFGALGGGLLLFFSCCMRFCFPLILIVYLLGICAAATSPITTFFLFLLGGYVPLFFCLYLLSYRMEFLIQAIFVLFS